MANRTIGTGISNNAPCGTCQGTYCTPGGSCWERFSDRGGHQCEYILNQLHPNNPPYKPEPGWSVWQEKQSTQSTNTIIISTNNGEIQVEVQRIAEIRYVDENDNVNSIPFRGYGKAQEITNYVMDPNNIEPPPRIGLTPSSPVAFQRKPIKVSGKYCRPCTSPLKAGCCGSDECWYMNGYGGQIGFMCQPPGIQSWPTLEESIAQLDKPLRSTTKSGLSYRTIIGAYSCGTQEAQACTNVCGHFEMGCCLPSATDPCPKWNSKLSTCYHIGLWSADNILIGKTYVCASSPAEALYIDCPTCSTTGGGSNPRDNTTTFGRQCVQKIVNGKPTKVCAPTNTGKQGQL